MDTSVNAAGSTEPEPRAPCPGGSSAPLSTLRGARLEVDGRRVGRAFAALGLIAIAVLAIMFFFIGAHKNAQISELRTHGTSVQLTVTTCIGLMGGSGSNEAGYSCTGTFSLDGKRFTEAIPGTTLYGPGTKIEAVAAENGRTSWRVYILPSVLLVAFAVLLGGWVMSRRRSRRRRPQTTG
jgi:hypothetical protein